MTASPFQLTSRRAIPALAATLEEYSDPASGARHLHLATDAPELCFLVAFPTVPERGDGRAHILEHLALAGSLRYPVRSPFFTMLRRSTATFMNAMTYADRTVYPFASTDSRDFFNLLDVYLDAAFFPQLDYLNFLQEGWRYTLDDAGKLGYQGVVFNEMKGAYADTTRALSMAMARILLQDTTYAVDSGGDPLLIPQLSHAMLQEFHASHYHPSQAVFMTTGAIDVAAVQEQIATRVLAALPGHAARRVPQLAPAWDAPRACDLRLPVTQMRPDVFGVQMGWLLGESADPLANAHAHVLSMGLLGDASAPLMRAMQSAGYGRPSRMNGRNASARQMRFNLGMDGLTEDQMAPARARLWDALEGAARDGIPVATLRGMLRDMRYDQRETSSGRTPYGLALLLSAVPLALGSADPLVAFDNDSTLATLATQIEDPDFFKSLVRNLLDNPTRLDARILPDADYFQARQAQETAHLATQETALTDAGRARIRADAAALAADQAAPANADLLPRILPGDVSTRPQPLPQPLALTGVHASVYAIASNNISYANVRYDVSHVSHDDWPWLRLYADVVASLGVGTRSYEEASAWRNALVPSFSLSLDTLKLSDGGMKIELSWTVSGLREEHAALADVLAAYVGQPRFDEHARLAFLIESMAQRKLDGVAEAGSHYATLAATAPLAALRHFDNQTSGAPSLAFYRHLLDSIATPEGLAGIAARLATLHDAMLAQAPAIVTAGSGDDGVQFAQLLKLPAPRGTLTPDSAYAPMMRAAPANTALHATSQVNHCVIAWPVPTVQASGSGALAVAAELISSRLLHQALREKGGAYGGYASYNGSLGIFSMTSYRDPRLAETYADFAAALAAVATQAFDRESIEEAIIGVIKGLDKPDAPYAQAWSAWNMGRRGVTEPLRQRLRNEVLGCTEADVKAAVKTWLVPDSASRAAFVGDATRPLAGLTLAPFSAA
ncbi:MAG: insulinase family protein [Pseudomonadota bacterium]|nr:insulinase family protein [Pseudomonadota bacterium]